MKKLAMKLLILFIISLGLIIGVLYVKRSITHRSEITDNSKVNKWYRITHENSISADGIQSHGLIRIGKENKIGANKL